LRGPKFRFRELRSPIPGRGGSVSAPYAIPAVCTATRLLLQRPPSALSAFFLLWLGARNYIALQLRYISQTAYYDRGSGMSKYISLLVTKYLFYSVTVVRYNRGRGTV